MKMMITCKEATKLIVEKDELSVSFIKRIQLWLHLGICSICKLFQNQNKVMNEWLKQVPEDETLHLSDSEKENMIQLIESSRKS